MEKDSVERLYDLNIFFREDWSPRFGVTLTDNLIIDVYIYEIDGEAVRRYTTDTIIEATIEETKEIVKHYPQNEYGTDWWEFAENFLTIAPPRIYDILMSLPGANKESGTYDLTIREKPTTT